MIDFVQTQKTEEKSELEQLYSDMPEYMRIHSERVARLVQKLYGKAKQLGLYTNDTDFDIKNEQYIFEAVKMYNIGWAKMPGQLYYCKSNPSEQEFKVIMQHPELGVKAIYGHLSDMDILEDSEENTIKREIAIAAAIGHHEHWDGTGYPYGIEGENIPLFGRLCAICDYYDMLTSGRLYSTFVSSNVAYKEILKYSRSYFDPLLAEAFRDCIS